jgi:phosphopantetheine adenylyltransferase/Zn-dependent peptidase ImmA (M78 family)
MNSLVKSLIQPILEQEGQKIALVPGGFKPPTVGHFSLVDEVAKNSNIDKVIVLIGHKNRDGVSKEESKAIWDIYKKYLPSNVEIQISDNSSPVADVASIIKNNPQNTYYPVVGIRGEMDLGDLKRFDSLKGKYDNFQTIVIKSEEGENRISGTNTRAALIGGEKERFQSYLPTELSDEEKNKVWSILQKTPIEEIVTQSELDDVERIADEWFEDYGIDVQFTRHFIERVNDERNGKPISAEELEDLFTQTAEKYGEKLANLPDDYQAVLFKLRNDINLPFALNYDDRNNEMDLVAKTVMRKKNFQTSNPKLALQEMYAEPSKFSYPPMIKSLTEYMLDKGMNIRPLPKVKFVNDDTENAQNFFGKTAYYNPNERVIVLYTMNRHPKDVMRSYAHEMIHHMQNCDGRLEGITTQNTNEEGDLPEIEREAYEKGNMTFRNWTDTLTEGVLKEETENDILAYKSTFKPDTNILVVFKENENYENLEPLFDKYGYGFYYPQDKTIIIDGEVFVNSSLDFNDLKFVEAHEVTHLLLGHTGPYSKDDEMDADLGAYILLKNKGLSTDKLVKEFKNRHGVDFDEKLLERVKDML